MANKGKIIGGADGPTSVFLLRHDQKQSFYSKIRRMKQRIKRIKQVTSLDDLPC